MHRYLGVIMAGLDLIKKNRKGASDSRFAVYIKPTIMSFQDSSPFCFKGVSVRS
jgi:hypothetical protein